MAGLKKNGIELCRFVAIKEDCKIEYSFRSNGWILKKPMKAWKRYCKIRPETDNMHGWIKRFLHRYELDDGWRTQYTFTLEGSKLYTQQSLLYYKKATASGS